MNKTFITSLSIASIASVLAKVLVFIQHFINHSKGNELLDIHEKVSHHHDIFSIFSNSRLLICKF